MPVTDGVYVSDRPPTFVTFRVTVWMPARSPIAIDARVQVARIGREARRLERVARRGADARGRSAQEGEPVVEPVVEHETRIGRVVRADMTRALAEDHEPGS